jgi:hypothetical protein
MAEIYTCVVEKWLLVMGNAPVSGEMPGVVIHL